MAEWKCKVLVKEIVEELWNSDVRPTTVDEYEAFKKAELGNGVVACEHSLPTLVATDTNAYMGCW